MSADPAHPATLTSESDWLRQLFTSSIADAVANRGAHLENLDWTVRIENGDFYVRGTPRPDCALPAELCRNWAATLDLFKQEYDAEEHQTVWFLYSRPWMIEVVCESRVL